MLILQANVYGNAIKSLTLTQQISVIEKSFTDKQYRCIIESTADGVNNICYTLCVYTVPVDAKTSLLQKYARIRYSPATKFWSYKTYVKVSIKKGAWCRIRPDIFLNLIFDQLLLLVQQRHCIVNMYDTFDNQHALFSLRSHAYVRRKPIDNDGDSSEDLDYMSHQGVHQYLGADAFKHSYILPFFFYTGAKTKYIITKRADVSVYAHVLQMDDADRGLFACMLLSKLLHCLVVLNYKGVVHRDIHLGNILLFKTKNQFGDVKLTDFGRAVLAGSPIDDVLEIDDEFFLQIPPEGYVSSDDTHSTQFDMWGVAMAILCCLSKGVKDDTSLSQHTRIPLVLFVKGALEEQQAAQITLDVFVDTIFDKFAGLSNVKCVLESMLKLDKNQRAKDVNDLYAHYLFLSVSNYVHDSSKFLNIMQHFSQLNSLSLLLYNDIVGKFCRHAQEYITETNKGALLDALLDALVLNTQAVSKIDEKFLVEYFVFLYKNALGLVDYHLDWNKLVEVLFDRADAIEKIHLRMILFNDRLLSSELAVFFNKISQLPSVSRNLLCYAALRLYAIYATTAPRRKVDLFVDVLKLKVTRCTTKSIFSDGLRVDLENVWLFLDKHPLLDNEFTNGLLAYIVNDLGSLHPLLIERYQAMESERKAIVTKV